MKERMNELREASGEITYSDPLTTLFYLLLRDHMPAGVLEKLVYEVRNDPDEVMFSNGWMAKYANNLSEQVLDARKDKLKNDLLRVFNSKGAVENTTKSDVADQISSLKAGWSEIDDSVLAELASKIKSIPDSDVDENDTIDPAKLKDVVNEAKSMLNEMTDQGVLSESVYQVSIENATKEDMGEWRATVEEKAEEPEAEVEVEAPIENSAPAVPPPPAIIGDKWQNTLDELDKEE